MNASLKSAVFRRRISHRAAFTLVEVLITMALFSLLLAGIVCGTVYGLKMCELTKAKLTRSSDARAAIGLLADEIRSSKGVYVGSVDNNGVFRAVLDGQPQAGNALLIYPTTNKSSFIVYFLNPSDRTFRRTESSAGSVRALAASVTNSVVFTAQDFQRNILTNAQHNRIIHVNLEFFQARGQSPTDGFYKLETAVTRRVN